MNINYKYYKPSIRHTKKYILKKGNSSYRSVISHKSPKSIWFIRDLRSYKSRGPFGGVASHLLKTVSGEKKIYKIYKSIGSYDHISCAGMDGFTLLRRLDTTHPRVSVKMGFALCTPNANCIYMYGSPHHNKITWAINSLRG